MHLQTITRVSTRQTAESIPYSLFYSCLCGHVLLAAASGSSFVRRRGGNSHCSRTPIHRCAFYGQFRNPGQSWANGGAVIGDSGRTRERDVDAGGRLPLVATTARRKHGSPGGKPPRGRPRPRAGLYVLNLFVSWQNFGDASYGFLVQVV